MWRRYVALFTAKNATQRGSVKREGGLVPRVPARMQLLVGERACAKGLRGIALKQPRRSNWRVY